MNKAYEAAKKEMLGKNRVFWPVRKSACRILAWITWRLNRFGDKAHNNAAYNKSYFSFHKEEIGRILTLLSDEYSRDIYRKCLLYRQTHSVKEQPDYNKGNQYFPKDIVKISQEEVFVDCGAYTGDTIRAFIKHCMFGYKQIIAFEPSLVNAEKLKGHGKNVIVNHKGVWDDNVSVLFEEAGEGSMVVETTGNVNEGNKIQCCRIDDCEECRYATFIKMDVEGAELRALKGAHQVIENNHPKLAICIYHTAEDMVMIPLYLMERYPFYQFYVRHHSHRCSETVLYAIPRD